MSKSLILCDCAGSQWIDAKAIADATGVSCSRIHTALCTRELEVAARALEAGEAVIACQQERATFEALADEMGVDAPGFVDLRDRAGWTNEPHQTGPKMAALAAEAMLPATGAKTVDVESEGVTLLTGAAYVVLPVAEQLQDSLALTVLITDDAELPVSRAYDVVRGRVARVSGALGGFKVRFDALQQIEPGGRGAFTLGAPRDGAVSDCDIIIDLSGGSPMVPAPEKREGYLRADPRDPRAVAAVVLAASQLTGTFEKPLYVRLEETLCAHSRAGQIACTNCLDICPTAAVSAVGDHVAIDPMVCAGCGACAALCPSTAITYDDPSVGQLLNRMQTLASTYRKAGGGAPRLLIHDAHGAEMIRLAARFGSGLPSDVIPLELNVISGFGHAEMLAGLAHGFAAVDILLAPTTERGALQREIKLATTVAGSGKLRLIDEADPDAVTAALYESDVPQAVPAPVLPLGNRRQITRLSTQALNPGAKGPIALPEGAPYGAVLVDTNACTLCLSCVSLCPSGALADHPDMPQLRFQEEACLQCGLCSNTCPENAIALKPQLDLSDAALTQVVLNEEEPFACVECGALFGVKSTVERIMDKLAGSHPMFASSDQARMIQMCDDCRVQSQYHSENNPFAAKERPRTRTTEDYYSERKDH